MKRRLAKVTLIIAICLSGAGGGFLIAVGFEKIGTIGMIGILGAAAGIASLAWQVRDRVLWIPKVVVTAELVYMKGVPTKIRHIINNTGKSTEIIHWGFASADGKIICCRHPGLIPHVARRGVPLIDDFDIDDVIHSAREKGCTIKSVFAEDNKGSWGGEIPQRISDVLACTGANNVQT